jgi:hypothetical protein
MSHDDSGDATGGDPRTAGRRIAMDMRRANVEPYAKVLSKAATPTGTRNPLLAVELAGRRKHIEWMSARQLKRASEADRSADQLHQIVQTDH